MPRKKYFNLMERLIANTRLEDPEDSTSCWIWTGPLAPGGYPKINLRRNGRHQTCRAHRVMLEEFHDIWFPFDEAGHLCNNPTCINPSHLEVQTKAFNLSIRRSNPYKGDKCMIPTLFPRSAELDAAVDAAWDAAPGVGAIWSGSEPPF